jgi:hypothetical protein
MIAFNEGQLYNIRVMLALPTEVEKRIEKEREDARSSVRRERPSDPTSAVAQGIARANR